MRRTVGLVLVGFGVFALVAAALVRFYAYPSLAVVPLDQESVSVSFGEDMTYFDVGTRTEKVADLTSTIRVIGDVEASEEAGDDIAVWDRSTLTEANGEMISTETQRAAFDRFTGEAVNCCDEAIDEEPVEYEGQVFKFPFDTQKETYQWFDNSLREAVPLEFMAVEELEGTTVYRFEGTVEPTKIADMNVPSSVVDEEPGELVSAERFYSVKRTYWVEPNTGAFVKAQEEPYETLRYEGEDRTILTAGTSGYDDATVKANAEDFGSQGSQLKLIRSWIPLGGLVLGVLALIAGAALVLTGKRRETA